jgi:hypothetical protein
MNYLLIYLKFIDQMIENHDKNQDWMQKVLKSFVPKVLPQPWMAPHMSYYRGLPISSLRVPECSFQVGYKWVVANASISRANFWREIIL